MFPLRVNAVDTSGAGDAFIGCLAHYYVQSGDVEAAMKSRPLAAFSVTGKAHPTLIQSIEQFNEYLSLNVNNNHPALLCCKAL